MASISLMSFMSYLGAAEEDRAEQVAGMLRPRAAGHPFARNSYAVLREAIVDLHQHNLDLMFLLAAQPWPRDSGRSRHYEELARDYVRWLDGRQLQYFAVRPAAYEVPGLTITIDPDLGLAIDGRRYAVNLCFWRNALRREVVEPLLHVIKTCLAGEDQALTPAVLHVRDGQLLALRASAPDPALAKQVGAEAAALAEILSGGGAGAAARATDP